MSRSNILDLRSRKPRDSSHLQKQNSVISEIDKPGQSKNDPEPKPHELPKSFNPWRPSTTSFGMDESFRTLKECDMKYGCQSDEMCRLIAGFVLPAIRNLANNPKLGFLNIPRDLKDDYTDEAIIHVLQLLPRFLAEKRNDPDSDAEVHFLPAQRQAWFNRVVCNAMRATRKQTTAFREDFDDTSDPLAGGVENNVVTGMHTGREQVTFTSVDDMSERIHGTDTPFEQVIEDRDTIGSLLKEYARMNSKAGELIAVMYAAIIKARYQHWSAQKLANDLNSMTLKQTSEALLKELREMGMDEDVVNAFEKLADNEDNSYETYNTTQRKLTRRKSEILDQFRQRLQKQDQPKTKSRRRKDPADKEGE